MPETAEAAGRRFIEYVNGGKVEQAYAMFAINEKVPKALLEHERKGLVKDAQRAASGSENHDGDGRPTESSNVSPRFKSKRFSQRVWN